MKEKIEKIKNFVLDNGDTIGLIIGTTIATAIGFTAGRISAKQTIEATATYTDKDGNLVKELYAKRVI